MEPEINENVTTENDIPDESSQFNSKPLSEAEMAAENLKVLMSKLDGDDKCVVCHAIRELEKKSSQSSSWGDPQWWFLLFWLLCSGYSNNRKLDLMSMQNFYASYLAKDKDEPSEAE